MLENKALELETHSTDMQNNHLTEAELMLELMLFNKLTKT